MKRVVLIIVFVLVAAGAAYAFMIMRDKVSGTDQNNNAVTVNRSIQNTGNTASVTNAAVSEKAERDQILGASRLFAERYGTTFSDNPASHLENVLEASSTALREALKKTMSKPAPVPDATAIARTFSVASLDLKRGTADVAVTLQRTEKEARLGAAKISFNQTLTLSLVRQDGWKVSVAVWGAKQ